MKVTVNKFLNVRVGKPSLNAPCYQYLAPGSELEVDGKTYKGDSFNGTDDWLKDEAGNYYWKGGIEIEKEIDRKGLEHNVSSDKIKFNWFKNLKIDDIWSKYNEYGEESKIAILDTGYNNSNPDLASAVIGESIIINSKEYPNLKDFIINDQSSFGHGTRCASLIGARNQFNWLVGIAPKSKLLIGKISQNREIRSTDYILDGIDWAIKQGAEVISLSFALELNEEQINIFKPKFESLISKKQVIIFAAAGNGSKQSGERYPASFPGYVSVGATDKNNDLSDITVLSEKTIMHAQGIDIESYGLKDIPEMESGTSYSTPIVAGIASLAISYIKKRNNGNWDKDKLLSAIYESGTPIINHQNKKIINPTGLFNIIKNQSL